MPTTDKRGGKMGSKAAGQPRAEVKRKTFIADAIAKSLMVAM